MQNPMKTLSVSGEREERKRNRKNTVNSGQYILHATPMGSACPLLEPRIVLALAEVQPEGDDGEQRLGHFKIFNIFIYISNSYIQIYWRAEIRVYYLSIVHRRSVFVYCFCLFWLLVIGWIVSLFLCDYGQSASEACLNSNIEYFERASLGVLFGICGAYFWME